MASLERKVRHLQEIVTDKEGIIDELKSVTDDQAEEIGLMREDGAGLDERERTRWESQVEELRELSAEDYRADTPATLFPPVASGEERASVGLGLRGCDHA